MKAAVYGPIVRRCRLWQSLAVSASTPVPLPPEDKLDLLRFLDEFHYWHALADERICKRCGCTISGCQILVIELQGRRGKLRLQCPTPGCASTPGDWVYANPVRAAKLRSEFPAAHRAGREVFAPQRVHRGATAKRKLAAAATHLFSRPASFRAALARLVLLRPIATALHAFRPVS